MAKLRDPFTPEQKRRWKALVEELKDELGFPLPTHIWRVRRKGRDWIAKVESDGTRFWIYISKYRNWEDAIEDLSHEAAHCLCYPEQEFGNERDDHNEVWGAAFSYTRQKIFDILDWEGENVTVVEKE